MISRGCEVDDETMHLAVVVEKWHANAIRKIKTIVETPDDTVINLDELASLSGNDAKMFKLGLKLAMNFIEKLPFEMNLSDEDEEV